MVVLQTTADVTLDRRLIITLPENVLPGRVHVTLSVDDDVLVGRHTAGEFKRSEFFGMFADRTDLPRSNDEFREWRDRIWSSDPE